MVKNHSEDPYWNFMLNPNIPMPQLHPIVSPGFGIDN